MRWHRLSRASLTAMCLLLFSSTGIVPAQMAQTVGQELRDIPVSLGGMAFNEVRNRGFDSQQVVTWEAKDIVVTTAGVFAAELKTRYDGPPVSYPVLLDVLFVQVQAEYGPSGDCPPGGVCAYDFYYEPLGDIVPLVANHSARRSARFSASETFEVPAVVETGSQLRTVWLNLTWVRVYDAGEGLAFHVFPGFADYYQDIPRIGFDQPPQTITGRLGYYQVLLGKRSRGVFNYQKWIRRYLNNR